MTISLIFMCDGSVSSRNILLCLVCGYEVAMTKHRHMAPNFRATEIKRSRLPLSGLVLSITALFFAYKLYYSRITCTKLSHFNLLLMKLPVAGHIFAKILIYHGLSM